MQIRALKYAAVWTGIAFGAISLTANGPLAYAMPVYAFVLVPLIELFLRPDPSNLDKTGLELIRNDRLYDYMLYAILVIQYAFVVGFLFAASAEGQPGWVLTGKIWAMGIGCGVLGINVAHELGHRITWYEKLMAKALLLTSLYMHFFIEHNRGHHMRVSTKEDPASARRGESLYAFWARSVVFSYLSAWKLENSRMKRKGLPVISLKNEMLVYHLVQGAFLGLIAAIFSWQVMLYYVIAAVTGILLLETVNYIEHYGLQREKLENGRYERVRPDHSWNSNHPLGRLILFELSRHSDHHYRSGRKYQLLRHMDGSPQMPTGYPGMMVLATIPPLWFAVMHTRIDAFSRPAVSA